MKHLALIVTLATAAGPPSLTQIPRWGAGALHFERLDVGPQEPLPEELTIEARPNGPLYVRGRVRLVGRGGELIREDTRVALCRCGHSANKPFLDGSHRRVGFSDSA